MNNYTCKAIERSEIYGFVCACFDDGFEAEEVAEMCEDMEATRTESAVVTHYYVVKHRRTDTFPLNDVMASQILSDKNLWEDIELVFPKPPEKPTPKPQGETPW